MNISFYYGALLKHFDVTDIAKNSFLQGYEIVIDVFVDFNKLFGDVYPNVVKQLTIKCENSEIVLPEKRNHCFRANILDLTRNPKYSVLITSYECKGLGTSYLRENLNALFLQTYRPLEIIVSDHSQNEEIKTMIQKEFLGKLNNIELLYDRYRENYGNPSENWNNAAKIASGELWHYFALDDFFANPDAIKNVVAIANDNPKVNWFACAHQLYPQGDFFFPQWNDQILQNNTISGPSAVVIRKKLHHVALDPQFIWFLDLDWYYRLYLANDKVSPFVVALVTWKNRVHKDQLSHTVCTVDRRNYEIELLQKKYGSPLPNSL